MKYGKTELIRRISDIVRNGWNNNAIRDLIESLWRDPFSHRTSGFVKEGGTDSNISVSTLMELVEGVPHYSIVFQIAPKVRKFDFYQFREVLTYHKKYNSESISFDATEGLHVVYYDFDPQTFEQILVHLVNPSRDELAEIMQWVVPITFLYYDADLNEIIYFGDNRHGSWWNPWIHWSWHQTLNSTRETGLQFINIIADGTGNLPAHAEFGISAGSCFHEDIYAISSGKAAPADLPVFYFIEGNRPRIYEGSSNSLIVQGLLCYNDSGSITAATDRWFVLYHVFFTNCQYHPFIAVVGQAQYEKVSTASYMLEGEVTRVKELLPHQNLLHIGTLILQTSTEFTNVYHSRIVTFAYGVKTDMTVTGDGSNVMPVRLINDQQNPGAVKYYGTDQYGIKGYHDFSLEPDTIIFQNDHGFEVGEAIRHNGTIYVKAKADNDVNAQVCGIVSEIIDLNRFKYVVDGFIPRIPVTLEWIKGAEYFLSPVIAGKLIVLSDPEVWMIGQVRISLGWGTTRGLKVEIDVGDVIGNYAGSEPFSFDKDFEFCIQLGMAETFKLDFSAGYAYTLARIKAESDGTLPGVSVRKNNQVITGLEDMDVSTANSWSATEGNAVAENDVITLHTTNQFGGTPTVLRVKMIFTIA